MDEDMAVRLLEKRKIIPVKAPENFRWAEHKNGDVYVNVLLLKEITWLVPRTEN